MANIEWNKLGSKKVIDRGACFTTEDGDLIYWSSIDSYGAQNYLQKILIQPILTKQMNKQLSEDALNALSQCSIDGNVIKLGATQLDRKIYSEVKSALENIGGQWKGGKIFGFLFEQNPTELLEGLQGGVKRNLKKEFQFFGTPDDLADYLVELAEIENTHDILEPSAGRGAIVKAIHRELYDSYTVWAFELMPLNQTFLDKIIGCRVLGYDFLKECDTSFDRIIANPPFNKNQDIDHILKMYSQLKSGGKLVSIASKHWEQSNNKKETAFKEWLKSVDAIVKQIPAGKFKESGTSIATCIIIIDKK